VFRIAEASKTVNTARGHLGARAKLPHFGSCSGNHLLRWSLHREARPWRRQHVSLPSSRLPGKAQGAVKPAVVKITLLFFVAAWP